MVRANSRIPVVVRSPSYPWRGDQNCLLRVDQLVRQVPTDVLINAVALVSESLPEAIKDDGAGKARRKLDLYAVRMSQRCTPFGVFSQLSAGSLEGRKNSVELVKRPSGAKRMQTRQSLPLQGSDCLSINATLCFYRLYYKYTAVVDDKIIRRAGSEAWDLLKYVWQHRVAKVSEIISEFPSVTIEDLESLVYRQCLIGCIPDDTPEKDRFDLEAVCHENHEYQ